MKQLLIFALALLTASFTTDETQQATVKKVSGKYVFYYNEPVQPYETVFTFTTTYPALKKGHCYTIAGTADLLMRSAMTEAGAQAKQFDAIIITHGQRDLAVKFKTDTIINNLAVVEKTQSKSVFTFCEPVKQYDVVESIKVRRGDPITGECRQQHKIVEMTLKDAEKSAKKGKSYDAIIQSDNENHLSIKFK
ncbi:MAG: hypothetical protein F9K23_15765 [Bacteroidetes bacterium]|nr:MAG: hypothetical protein F9K23_15765 [Bacteroidota bacterium]